MSRLPLNRAHKAICASFRFKGLKNSEKQARTALKILEKLQITASKPTNKCTVVSLINWRTYQQQLGTEGPAEGPECLALTGPGTGFGFYSQ